MSHSPRMKQNKNGITSIWIFDPSETWQKKVWTWVNIESKYAAAAEADPRSALKVSS